MLNQKLQQKLLQKLSPQQIQLMKLLQIPAVAIEQRIKQEIEENPALEETADSENEKEYEEYDDDKKDDSSELQNDEFDLNDYIDDNEIPSYKLYANNQSSDDEVRDIPFSSGVSFHDTLRTQLGLRTLTPKQLEIGEFIIGNIDESGYIKRETVAMVDDLMFSQNMEATAEEIEEVLAIIQEFDPPGVGARNLQECLLLQLDREKTSHQNYKNAKLILERFFNEFTKKHYSKIIKKSNISEEELKQAIKLILSLNPKPGSTLNEGSRVNQYIIPDFYISNNDGVLELSLNNRYVPELRINRSYSEMLENFSYNKNKTEEDKQAVMFVKQKIDSAKWFIDAIKQRQNTLHVTMEAIMNFQKEYFLDGDETKLKPMILKDIAEIVGLDISTISRVANSKYVQTPYGTFLLKSFFSESMQTDSGEEVSTREIKKILSNSVEKEDKQKPLTDEQLAELLKEKGYNIARRTVSKYREQLSIPVARLRKEL
ncbi:MAG TPA: RNA polymerase sigma-54 factor [Bacteroidetes bacterium]|nr:RNA polymerase sigma-54 factor [Bacteroidota bacterium]